jgi:hypothetical protein
MDADNSLVRKAAPAQGGTVEPANRAPVAIERFQTPTDTGGERYEMRDHFAEVTYRANTFREMVAKADQLGSTRIVAIAEDGKRTPIQKVDGEWQRGSQRRRATTFPRLPTWFRCPAPPRHLDSPSRSMRRPSPRSTPRPNAPRLWLASSPP